VSVLAGAPQSVAELLALYERRGAERYGEDVTQTEHAMQCAALAVEAGAVDELVCAALLHDLGHLLSDGDASVDDRHELVGAHALRALFGPSVAVPVALHVVAKRWRCAADPAYLDALSDASRRSLALQGGPLDDAARARFETHGGFANAVALRGWDDEAKRDDLSSGDLAQYAPLLTSLAARPSVVA
jgi:predicted HD phosphohydrolase